MSLEDIGSFAPQHLAATSFYKPFILRRPYDFRYPPLVDHVGYIRHPFSRQAIQAYLYYASSQDDRSAAMLFSSAPDNYSEPELGCHWTDCPMGLQAV